MPNPAAQTPPPAVLTVAGSDPTGGAGLQMDLQVFALHGVHGMAVPTALTVQTTKSVERVLPVFPNTIGEHLMTPLTDVRPAFLKLGVLATDDVLLRVAILLERFDIPRVVDPILRASDGSYLLERRAWGNLIERLINGAALVTPNLDECENLMGTRDPDEAAEGFLEAGAQAVLVKGGHAEGDPDDRLFSAEGSVRLPGARLGGEPVHGTGCALSAAITARLARGESLGDAVAGAKAFVAAGIANSFKLGAGQVLGLAGAEGTR